MPEPRTFPTGGLVAAEDLVGREPTLRDLYERTYNQRNSIVLTATRQTGKTSVVHELLRRIRKAGGWGIYIDCQSATDVDDFIALVASATYDQAAGGKGAFGKLADFVKSLPLHPTLFQADADIALTFHSERQVSQTQKLERALGLADQLGAEKKRRVVVVYDEFPMLRKLSPKLFDQIRAVLQRANTHASYVFMGSEVGVLEELFKSRRRMPFRLGTTIEMPMPAAQEWVKYIERRFGELGRPLASGEAAQLVSFTGGHPRNLMEACQHLLTIRNLRDGAAPEDVELAQIRTSDGLRLHFEDVWNNLDEPKGTKTVAARIATGRNVYGRGRGLEPPQVKRALDRLEHEGLIRRVRRGGYEFSDALFGRYVRETSDRT